MPVMSKLLYDQLSSPLWWRRSCWSMMDPMTDQPRSLLVLQTHFRPGYGTLPARKSKTWALITASINSVDRRSQIGSQFSTPMTSSPQGRFDILRMIIRTTRSQFICGSLLIIDEQDQIIGTKRGIAEPEYDLPPGSLEHNLLTTQDIRRYLCNQNFVATTSNMTFHKDLFAKINGFADFRYVHDWDLALRATMLAECVYTANPLTKYRVHSSNTIKENSSHIDGEVVRMITQFLEDFPAVETDSACRLSLTHNRHLGRYVPPERLGRQVADKRKRIPLIGLPKRIMEGAVGITLPGCLVPIDTSVSAVPWDVVTYLHSPDGELRLPQRALDMAAFCLAHFDYDFILFSEALDELSAVRIVSLRDAAFFNARAAGLIERGETPRGLLLGRVIRLQPAVDERAQEFDLQSLPGFAGARFQGAEISLGRGPKTAMNPTPLAQADLQWIPHRMRCDRPRVMILPIFLAVGGVERNMVEVIRTLQSRYEFIVITTERLAMHQGSLHFQLDDLGVQVLDFAEIGDRQHHITLLETVNRAYPADVVWICNGSPWLADNSEEVRRIFLSYTHR